MKTKVANLPKPWLALFTSLMLLDKTLGLLLLVVFLLLLGGTFLTMFLMIISITFSP
jgi:hypothetical protein